MLIKRKWILKKRNFFLKKFNSSNFWVILKLFPYFLMYWVGLAHLVTQTWPNSYNFSRKNWGERKEKEDRRAKIIHFSVFCLGAKMFNDFTLDKDKFTTSMILSLNIKNRIHIHNGLVQLLNNNWTKQGLIVLYSGLGQRLANPDPDPVQEVEKTLSIETKIVKTQWQDCPFRRKTLWPNLWQLSQIQRH